jgi:hypothetical protein
MASCSVDTEPGVVSELIDLDRIPLSELRELNHAALHKSLRHVVTRTTVIDVVASYDRPPDGGAERVD